MHGRAPGGDRRPEATGARQRPTVAARDGEGEAEAEAEVEAEAARRARTGGAVRCAVGSAAASGRTGALAGLAAAIGVGAVAFTQIKLVLDQVPPLVLAAGRVSFSALAFVLVVAAQPWRRRPVARADRWAVLACGLGGSAVFHLLYSWGQQRVSVGIGAVVLGTMPVLVAVGEVVFLRHRLRGSQVAGLLLSVVGVAVMSGGPGAGAVSVAGLLAVAAATLAWAGVVVTTRSLGGRYDPWWLNTPGTVVGAVVVLLLVAPDAGAFRALSPVGWFHVVWLGAVGSAFIYAALAAAVAHLPATTTASLSTLVTPLGVVVAWVALGDRPTTAVVVGGIVVVAGAWLVTAAGARAGDAEGTAVHGSG